MSKKNIKQIIKFAFSSILSFVIDYSLYTLFNILGLGIVISNIMARIISASFNYTVNRNVVFKSNSSVKKSAFEYFLLALIVLLVNTSLLMLFVNVLSLDKYLSKLIIEVIVFSLSYIVQHKIIFKR